MIKLSLSCGAAAALALAWCRPALADLTVKVRYTEEGRATESTTYIQGARQRFEFGKELTLIQQCDLGRIVELDEKARTYRIVPLQLGAGGGQPECPTPAKPAVSDTGEQQEILGRAARRIKTSVQACGENSERVEIDGWYIDLEQPMSCRNGGGGAAAVALGSTPHYPVRYTMTTHPAKGSPSTMSFEVLDLNTSALSAAIFELPEGYTESKLDHPDPPVPAVAASKLPEAVRIGAVALLNKTGGAMATASFDDRLIGALKEARLDAVSLGFGEAVLESRALEAQCDYILHTELIELKKSAAGKVGGLLSRAARLGQEKEIYEARIDFRLVAPSAAAPVMAASITGKTGSFTAREAVQIARTAATVATALTFGPAMFNPSTMSGLGTASSADRASPMGGLDPGLLAFQSVLQVSNMFAGDGPAVGSSEQAAVWEAIERAAKAVAAHLRPRK